MKQISFLVFSMLVSFPAWANALKHPYGCTEMDHGKGVRWIKNWTASCYLRTRPEDISTCQRRAHNNAERTFKVHDKSMESSCYNINGRLTSTWCVTGNEWQTSGSSAYWYYQVVKAYYCWYN